METVQEERAAEVASPAQRSAAAARCRAGREFQAWPGTVRTAVIRECCHQPVKDGLLPERVMDTIDGRAVICRGERFHFGLGRNFEVTDALEWIARITSHIPREGARQVIGCGIYSHAWRCSWSANPMRTTCPGGTTFRTRPGPAAVWSCWFPEIEVG